MLRYAAVPCMLVIALHSKWWNWWGGVCYGPRLLADLTPVLSISIYPLGQILRRSRTALVLFCLLLAWSATAHFIGAFWDDGRWDGYELPGSLWSWRDNPLANPIRELVGRAIVRLHSLPTSATSPDLLHANYIWESGGIKGTAGNVVPYSLQVVNTGKAVWLAWPKKGTGSVALLWKLSKLNGSPRVLGGAIPLRHDVFPGAHYRFGPSLILPEAGTYNLEIGLAVNDLGSFEDLGTRPLSVVVRVRERAQRE